MENNLEQTEEKKDIVLGLDVSTACIGVCIMWNDGSEYGKIIELTHINPKSPRKIKGIEELFLKKRCFEEYIKKFEGFKITKCVIEEPLLMSNNQNTVATLLRFNGMVSDCIYNTFGIVPSYISSYDARKYAFPELLGVRKYGKDDKCYPKEKILKAIKQSKLVLFGSYPWTIEKKAVLQEKVSEIFPKIEWQYDKNGELTKENFDATDSWVACIGYINKERYGELNPVVKNVECFDKKVEYDVSYWDKTEHRTTYIA